MSQKILIDGSNETQTQFALLSDNDGNAINMMYFWVTGILSAFLDNAPTYLVFFNTAGGDPSYLMNDGMMTLVAISAGAVFMGAMSYIGNAPNFIPSRSIFTLTIPVLFTLDTPFTIEKTRNIG